jgi:ABC-2 type transport system ATP-binding protein
VSTATGPALLVDGLVKRYGSRAVVDGLDLVAGRGAVTTVLGPNGAGKTTTLEICEGLRRADAGRVEVLGRRPGDPALRALVGVMLQDGGVYGAVTVREAIRHAAALYRQSHPVADLLATLGLEEVAAVPARRLSGGQRQRLGVALAIVGRPELVFLDEPTAGLDPQSRLAVWDLIGSLRDAGVSVVITTHYLEEAEQLADHVVIVDRGRSVAAGRTSDLVQASDSGGRLRFSASRGLPVDDLVEALPAGATATEGQPGEYLVTVPRAEDLGAALARVSAWCADRGVNVTAISSEERSLEDVFLELTGEELRP